MLIEKEIRTRRRSELIRIDHLIEEAIAEAGLSEGRCVVFVPHTTAGVTINENADPDVKSDILAFLEKLVPRDEHYFQHSEGNSDAHIKATLVGSSVQVAIKDRRLVLGTWQSVFFCEFDGPRDRRVQINLS